MKSSRELDKMESKDSDVEKEDASKQTFDAATFRERLGDAKEAIKEMKAITKAYTAWTRQPECEDVVRLVLQELKSTNGSELVQLINTERTISELVAIFETLECIFLRIADDLTEYETWSLMVVKQLLQQPILSVIDRGLSRTAPSAKVATLTFLTSMVTISAAVAKEVAFSFHFKPRVMIALLLSTYETNDADIRTYAVHFILSFLIYDDDLIIKKILERKRIVNGIFSGLANDKFSTIQMVLRLFQSQVLERHSLTKTFKICVFTDENLKNVFSLFNWSSSERLQKKKKWKKKLRETEGESAHLDEASVVSEHEAAVRLLAYEFLIAICGSSENGIVFNDKTVGTSKKNFNLVISNLLRTVEKPFDNPMVEKTVIEILNACPDQMKFYFSLLNEILVPKVSPQWFSAMSFVIKVYYLQVLKSKNLISVINNVDREISPQKLISIILNVIHVAFFNQDNLTAMLNHSCFAVRDNAIHYIEILLNNVTPFLIDDNEDLARFAWSPSDVIYFQSTFIQTLKRILPNLEVFCQCWDLAIQKPTASSSNNDEQVAKQDLQNDDEVSGHVKLLLNIMTSLLHIFPKSAEKGNVLAGLLDDVEMLRGQLTESNFNAILMDALTLLRHCSKDSLLCKNVGGRIIASILCGFIHETSDAKCCQQAVELIKELLLETGLFSANKHEVDIWINACHAEEDADVAHFFETSIIKLISNSQLYFDVLYKNSMQLISATNQAEAAAYDKIFDDILQDEPLDEKKNIATWQSSFELYPQYSPMVIVAIESLKEMPNSCQRFVTTVFYNLLHCQHRPEVFCSLLHKFKSCLPSAVRKYIKLFNPSKDVCKQDSSLCKKIFRKSEHISGIVYEMFVKKTPFMGSVSNDHLQNLMVTASHEDIFQLVNQLLCYLNHLLTCENKDDYNDLVLCYCHLLMSVMSDEIYNNLNYEFQTRIGLVILNHPIIHSTFSHREFIQSGLQLELMRILASVIQAAFVKTKSLNQISDFPILQNKIEEFIMCSLDLLKKDCVSVTNMLYSLRSIIESVLPLMELRVLQSLILNFCQVSLDLLVKVKKNKTTLNDLGKLFGKILDFIVSIVPSTNFLCLTTDQVQYCCKLHMQLWTESREGIALKCSLTNHKIGSALIKLLESNSLYALSIAPDFLKYCLDNYALEINQRLAVLLLERNFNLIPVFERWLLKKINAQNYVDYMLLVMSYLNQIEHDLPWHCSDLRATSLRYLVDVHWPLISELTAWSHSEQNEPACRLLKSFLELDVLDADKRMEFASQLTLCFQSDVFHSRSLLLASKKLFMLLSDQGLQIKSKNAITLYAILCINTFLGYAKQKSDSSISVDPNADVIKCIVGILESDLQIPRFGALLHKLKLWHVFVKTTLKIGLRDEDGYETIHLLHSVIKRLHHNKELLHFHTSTILELLFGHSRFISGLLDGSPKNSRWRERLVDLILLLVAIQPSVCHKDHVPIYLASYNATLSQIDQKLLTLLFYYEKEGIDMQSYKPLLFGKAAIEHYSVMNKMNCGLWRQSSIKDVLLELDKRKLLHTALHFPLDMDLVPGNASGQSLASDNFAGDLYDPRFIFPLFSHLLSPESVMHCWKFIESNGLALVFASLGSESNSMRAVGYHLLTNFYYHLSSLRPAWAKQCLYVLEIIRNGLEIGNVKLPNIITTFLIRTYKIIFSPDSLMCKPIVNFLFIRPSLDLWNVPEFFVLFNSSDIKNHQLFRNWILCIIKDGIRGPVDYRICQKRHIFKILLSAMQTPIHQHVELQLQVLKILKTAAEIPAVILELFSHNGVLAVISGLLKNCSNKVLHNVIWLLHISLRTLFGEVNGKNSKSDACNSTMNPDMASSPRLSNVVITEIALTLFAVSSRLGTDVPLLEFEKYVETLAQFLNWITKNHKKFQVAKIGLNGTVIENLIHSYQSIVKERYIKKPATNHSSKVLLKHSDSRKQIPVIDPWKYSSITRCRENVCDILLHWKCDSLVTNVTLGSFDDMSELFMSTAKFLLRSLLPFQDNFNRIHKIYSWLNEHLRIDRLTLALHLSSRNFYGVFHHIFRTFEYLLTLGDSDELTTVRTADKFKLKLDITVQLCKTFFFLWGIVQPSLSITENTNHEVSEVHHKSMADWLRSIEAYEMYKLPIIQKLVKDLNEISEDDQYKAAASLSILACELWLRGKETAYFEDYIQRTYSAVLKDFTIQDPSMTRRKRKSDGNYYKVVKKQKSSKVKTRISI